MTNDFLKKSKIKGTSKNFDVPLRSVEKGCTVTLAFFASIEIACSRTENASANTLARSALLPQLSMLKSNILPRVVNGSGCTSIVTACRAYCSAVRILRRALV